MPRTSIRKKAWGSDVESFSHIADHNSVHERSYLHSDIIYQYSVRTIEVHDVDEGREAVGLRL
jgi:hypothetical protein